MNAILDIKTRAEREFELEPERPTVIGCGPTTLRAYQEAAQR